MYSAHEIAHCHDHQAFLAVCMLLELSSDNQIRVLIELDH